jgi:hypothetical protein
MPRYDINLEEQLSDARSNEVAYRLRIENLGETPIDVLTISPRIPENVELIEVKDSSSEATKLKHKKLCSELTELLSEHVFIISKESRERDVTIQKEHLQEIIKDLNTIWKAYFKLITGKMEEQIQRRKERSAAGKFIIDSRNDAEIALEKWFGDESQDDARATIFRAKFAQLEKLEAKLGADATTTAIATIESDSFFATTYVLRFPRSGLNSRKFSFSVEVALSETGSSKEQLSSASATVVISPRPYVLSGVAMLSALLGSIVKYAIGSQATDGVSDYFGKLSIHLLTSPGLSAVILALVLFNIYEYTEFGKTIKMGVSWRSALLIGVLSGVFSDRIIDALKVLFGA